MTTLKTGLGGGSQVLGIGIKGSLTGKHADWIIVDDIANRKDKDSHAEREFTKAVWQELQNVKNPEGRSIAIGTVWHPDDVFSMMPKADIYTCYETGLLTNDQIEEIKHTMTPSLFAANYELKFVADEDAIFTDYQMLYDKDLDMYEYDDTRISNEYKMIDFIVCIDEVDEFVIIKENEEFRLCRDKPVIKYLWPLIKN